MRIRFLAMVCGSVSLVVVLSAMTFHVVDSIHAAQINFIADAQAENHSEVTTCAEDDNINVPIFADVVDDSRPVSSIDTLRYRITATHPTYDNDDYSCAPDFSGCTTAAAVQPLADDCDELLDDGTNVLNVCTVADWWRPDQPPMRVTANGNTMTGHYFNWHRRIVNTGEYPQFMVLYQDGNMRLKPQPPELISDTCFGSSVIVGPALPADRPYVDISRVVIDPEPPCIDITYLEGGKSQICFDVSREQAVADVRADYTIDDVPFTTFRSMWVADGNSDVARVRQDAADNMPIMDWTTLAGRSWFFSREVVSIHNASAPDIEIEAYSVSPTRVAPPRNRYATATPLLTWHRITSASEYEIQISSSPAFRAPLEFSTLVSANTLRVTPTPLADGIWYWRVRAIYPNGNRGRWSAPERFLVDAP